MGVHEFSLGFGPKIIWFKRKETLYAVRLLPLGGYVRIVGMEDDADNEGAPNGFYTKPYLSKFATLLAGSGMNILFGLLLIVLIGTTLGFPDPDHPDPRPIIGDVLLNSPADRAGIKRDDLVLTVDGNQVTDWDALSHAIKAHKVGNQFPLELDRKGKEITVQVAPKYIDTPVWDDKKLQITSNRQQLIGISPGFILVKKRAS